MKFFIAGGTGFVGRHLVQRLLDSGHQVTALGSSSTHPPTQRKPYTYICADTTQAGDWQAHLQDADTVVNLAGRTIFKRWTAAYKQQIYDSRILTTRHIVAALPANKNITLCNTSAVGFYGSCGDAVLTEDAPPGDDFLARLGQDWESEALQAEKKGVRVVLPRFGIILGRKGGALAQMIPVFKMGVGGPLGDGGQWFPWIHVQDLIAAMTFVIDHNDISGPLNLTAPNPVRNKELASCLGRVLKRPAFMPAPKMMLRLMMGEMGDVLLASQRAVPERLARKGFEFRFTTLEEALVDLVK